MVRPLGCGWRIDLPIWTLYVNILNRWPRTADKASCPPAWGLGEVLTTPHPKDFQCHETLNEVSDL